MIKSFGFAIPDLIRLSIEIWITAPCRKSQGEVLGKSNPNGYWPISSPTYN